MSKVSQVAILIDGGFFIQRFKKLHGKKPLKKDVVDLIDDIMTKVKGKSGTDFEDILYRSYSFNESSLS